MNTETLQINIESPIATVTLNRPDVLNAFNEQLVLDLQQAFKNLTAVSYTHLTLPTILRV